MGVFSFGSLSMLSVELLETNNLHQSESDQLLSVRSVIQRVSCEDSVDAVQTEHHQVADH